MHKFSSNSSSKKINARKPRKYRSTHTDKQRRLVTTTTVFPSLPSRTNISNHFLPSALFVLPTSSINSRMATLHNKQNASISVTASASHFFPLRAFFSSKPFYKRFPLNIHQIALKHPISTTSLSSFSTTSSQTTPAPSSTPHDCSHPSIQSLFEMLNHALEPMMETNKGMRIETHGDNYEFHLHDSLGCYYFYRDPNESALISRYNMTSHKSKNTNTNSNDLLDPLDTSTTTAITPPIIMMTSPISGNCYQYYYDNKRLKQWVSIHDEHYLVELMTRELLKKCYSYPMF